ncbi:hypothetical protein RJ639_006603 [Escallonia herrerae]|uniref:Retrotransposon gag domain-containing protein n=1 Tax=Escallonia herrerae TaxID=1293975 RepID=A0AA88VZY9_9ASTE|nr:hypothetical protein RJ639_006603 [Escallonia herrerae]
MYHDFLNLRQGENESVAEYKVKFMRLSRYGKQLVADEKDRVHMFTWGLKPSIRQRIVPVPIETYVQCVDIVKTIKAEAKDYRERKDAKTGKRDRPELSQSHMAQGDGKRRQIYSSTAFGQRGQGQRQGQVQSNFSRVSNKNFAQRPPPTGTKCGMSSRLTLKFARWFYELRESIVVANDSSSLTSGGGLGEKASKA